ncbi:DUF998 domain-containing protein [uncultured Jatrophihabitans sp.]|uniref:DUF998 domain-containing protein n=1 Tax=uncultured Jatrophihabitans sp. TaxID=1610747 RepID=UPI0035C95ABE
MVLIGGWTLGAARQPASYDSARDTISALAARGADDRWIMTLGLALLGVCHLATAAGLTSATAASRILLAVGGAATVAVAAQPQPSPGHVPAAAVGFVALALWPALSVVPSLRAGLGATVVLVALLAWLLVELQGGGSLLGVAERAVAGGQALWPLLAVVMLLARHGARRA